MSLRACGGLKTPRTRSIASKLGVVERGVQVVVAELAEAEADIVEGLQDARPVAGDGGEERFYTGLKPEIGLGYGDFMLGPGITYTLHISGGGQAVVPKPWPDGTSSGLPVDTVVTEVAGASPALASSCPNTRERRSRRATRRSRRAMSAR